MKTSVCMFMSSSTEIKYMIILVCISFRYACTVYDYIRFPLNKSDQVHCTCHQVNNIQLTAPAMKMFHGSVYSILLLFFFGGVHFAGLLLGTNTKVDGRLESCRLVCNPETVKVRCST